MRTLRNIAGTLLPVLALALLAGCNGTPDADNSSQSGQEASQGNSAADSGWPTEPQELVDHLNDWHADELLAYNEPERFPDRVTSGETNGWISAHEEELKKIGILIEWDKTGQKYKIANPKN